MEDSEIRAVFSSQSEEVEYQLYGSEAVEPASKRRCIRFSSDLSPEDPSIVSDSGFSDLASGSNLIEENGDLEVASFFGVDLNVLVPLPRDLDIEEALSADDELDFNEEPKPTSSKSSAENSTLKIDAEPGCSSSSSYNSYSVQSNATQSSSSEDDELVGEEEQQSESAMWAKIFLNHIDVVNNPGRTKIIERLIKQLRRNPNDAQLKHLFQLILAGPEFNPPRSRLRHVTHITDVIRLLRCSKKILALTGAGISVSCGIPDFRSKDGLYARVSKVFPNLPDPQSVFDIRLFRRDPRPFFLTAKELYPGQFEPSLSHRFLRRLETRGQMLRNYSQNIDTLENVAGIKNVTMCHGSFSKATCIRCKHKVDADEIKDKVLKGEVPFCPSCSSPEEISGIVFPLPPHLLHPSPHSNSKNDEGDDDSCSSSSSPSHHLHSSLPPVLKPDIVFFGEDLPDEFHENLEMDKTECDLLLVIGSSLRVRPVSLIPGMINSDVPQILINRESLSHCRFDVELLGNCDEIISQLCRNLGSDFSDLAASAEFQEINKLPRGEEVKREVVDEPKSENDIQALKACWEPKTTENVSKRLPENSYLQWNPRQYVFPGAEVVMDEDDEEDEESSDSDSSSDSSISSNEIRENGISNTEDDSSSTIIPTNSTQSNPLSVTDDSSLSLKLS